MRPGQRFQSTTVAVTLLLAPAGGGVLWNSAPLPGRMLLGSASLSLGFTATDSPGTYQIQARVADRISSRTLDLVAPLQLTAD